MTQSKQLQSLIAAIPDNFADPGADYRAVREGALRLGLEAIRAGVDVRLESWPGAILGWHGLANANIPEALQAWQAIRAYIATLKGTPRSDG